MNIYRTKSGNYINVDLIKFTELNFDDDPQHPSIVLYFGFKDTVTLRGNVARAFIEFLDTRCPGVYQGWA